MFSKNFVSMLVQARDLRALTEKHHEPQQMFIPPCLPCGNCGLLHPYPEPQITLATCGINRKQPPPVSKTPVSFHFTKQKHSKTAFRNQEYQFLQAVLRKKSSSNVKIVRPTQPFWFSFSISIFVLLSTLHNSKITFLKITSTSQGCTEKTRAILQQGLQLQCQESEFLVARGDY